MHMPYLTVLIALALAAPAAAVLHPRNPESSVRRVEQDKPLGVAGTWALTVETDQGTGHPSVTFEQDGEKLTGTYSSQVFGEHPVTGTVKGSAITFAFTGSFEGNTFTVTYEGTVEHDTMKGKVTLGDFGQGTFTGKKK